MSLIAEFTLDTPILVNARTTVPAVEFTIEDEFVSSTGTPILTAWVTADEATLDELDDVLSGDSTLDSACLLADMGDRRLYRLELTEAGATALTYPRAVDEGFIFQEISGSGDDVYYRARVPDRQSLTAYRRLCDERDLNFRLLGLYRDETSEADSPSMTDRQREVLRAAYEAGYFDVPRRTRLATLSDELDVSEQALSTILRRGQANLLADTVASDLVPTDAAEGT
ncbi:helix-turn-helix domain-containing protein [Halovivax cerinus]|uniref:Helix-turn-helix domain-containing protein n=1 Tax=Halovivax cerinus TaxID=1487865 RepID=A0ABD5NPZ0_9EURY|nr:helix-turn-helix domain-containing protein [Halovivax cerinus]